MYYQIDEHTARMAHEANSMRPFQGGRATAEYRAAVDTARQIVEEQKQKVAPCYHDKIDYLLDLYAKKLAENTNKRFSIDARMPSILISGGGGFNARKKEKQNAARDKNMQEYFEIERLLDKIRGVGTGGIRCDEPEALERLRAKLVDLEQEHNRMKAVNAYYRKHKSFDGCSDLTPDELSLLNQHIERGYSPASFFSNNLPNIKRIKERIAALERLANNPLQGWEFDGGEVVANTEVNRLQIIFEGKPDADLRQCLKKRGFRWSPRFQTWQRQLTPSAVSAAREVLSTS